MTGTVFETTAAEISRNFGQWQDRALQGPVTVTHHGRPRVVIVSSEEYSRLTRGDVAAPDLSNVGIRGRMSEPDLSALLEGMAEGFIALDETLRITAVNAVVEAFMGRAAGDLIGKNIASVGQTERIEVFIDRYRWVLRTGEAATFEATSHMSPGRMLRVRAFPFRGGVGVIFTNLTELMALREEQSDWKAMRTALTGHDVIATANLNLLGFVTSASPSFLQFVGFDSDQLTDVRLSDLVAAGDRQVLARGLNDLLRSKAAVLSMEVDFLTRNAGRQRMKLSLAARLRDLAYEGFSIVALPTQAISPEVRNRA